MEKKEKKLPKRIIKLLGKMDNQRLVKTLSKTTQRDIGVYFHLDPSGKSVTESTALLAIQIGCVVPFDGGLFPDSIQSWIKKQ